MNIYFWDLHVWSNLDWLYFWYWIEEENKEKVLKSNLYHWLKYFIDVAEKFDYDNNNFETINIYYLWDLIWWYKNIAWVNSKEYLKSFSEKKDDINFLLAMTFEKALNEIVENFQVYVEYFLMQALEDTIWIKNIKRINHNFILWNHDLLINDTNEYKIYGQLIQNLNSTVNEYKKHKAIRHRFNFIENKLLIQNNENFSEINFWNIWYTNFVWLDKFSIVEDIIEKWKEIYKEMKILNKIIDWFFWKEYLINIFNWLKIKSIRIFINRIWKNFVNVKNYYSRIIFIKEYLESILKEKSGIKIDKNIIKQYINLLNFITSKKLDYFFKNETNEGLFIIIFISSVIVHIEYIYNLILLFNTNKIKNKNIILNRLMHFPYNIWQIQNKKEIYSGWKMIEHWKSELDKYYNKDISFFEFEINLIKYFEKKINKNIKIQYYSWHTHKNKIYKIKCNWKEILYFMNSLWYWHEWIFKKSTNFIN